MRQVTIVHEQDSHAIPFNRVKEALDFMEYGSVVRVMFLMLYYTGCRISELDKMELKHLHGRVFYWELGKHQRKFRKEKLPQSFINELRVYRESHRGYATKLFGIQSKSFRRYFNKDVRPFLSKAWQEKRLTARKGELKPQYVLQLKGLRKDFQTLKFAQEFKKWGDSGVALEFTSKRMKHSSTNITAFHYLENFDSLGIQTLSEFDPERLVESGVQQKLLDFRFIKN